MACDSSTKDWYARRGVHQRPLIASHGEVEVSKALTEELFVLFASAIAM